MAVIYKYPFAIDDNVSIDMQVGAKVVLVEAQNGVATMWVLVFNPNLPTVQRRFRVVGTGHPFDFDRLSHVASFQQPPFVWHLFECLP